jgi:PKD repeat protein
MFYTALGHTDATYTDTNFLKHLLGGMETAAGMTVDADCGVDPNAAPVVTVTRTPAGTAGSGEPVAFTATATDADGDALTYAWDFGDGGTATVANPTHTYTAAGTYTAKVTVSDGKGGTDVETISVVVETRAVSVQGDVGANVNVVLALAINGAASLGQITPGIGTDYATEVNATVTSTAGNAALTVTDPDSTNPGKLVNGTYVLPQSLQVRATNAANPSTAFAAVPGVASPLTLLSYPRAISSDPVKIGFKQTVGAGDTLRAGQYGKTLTFTLSTTQP